MEESKIRTSLIVISVILCIALLHLTPSVRFQVESDSSSVEAPEWFIIEGLVENPLNLSYSELWNFPIISEVTTLQCIGSGQPPYGPSITYNWTGVPLSYLLSMAKVIPGDYIEVVFNATDGFSSSIMLDVAMHPTTILALEANGTDLEQIIGFGSGYRVVLPCRWGYKWVKWIKQITVIDYDYKGTYEQWGLSDEAIRPNCTMPMTDPPIRTFNATPAEEDIVQVLSNSSIEVFSFMNGQITFNVSGQEEANGYVYVAFRNELLVAPYQVYVDENRLKFYQTETNGNAYLFFTYTHSAQYIELEVAGTFVKPLKSAVGHGYSTRINVTISNPDNSTQDFNVTLYSNTIPMASQIIQLANDSSTTITYVWNTTDWNKGNYTISVTVTQSANETSYVLFANKEVCVTIPGDLDADFDVDLYDAVKLLANYGTTEDDSGYDHNSDINSNGQIFLFDAVILLIHYGQNWQP